MTITWGYGTAEREERGVEPPERDAVVHLDRRDHVRVHVAHDLGGGPGRYLVHLQLDPADPVAASGRDDLGGAAARSLEQVPPVLAKPREPPAVVAL
ncbi:MAG TPA: hypothetical protein VLK28_06890, partial [Methylomirabilota bacterium]|nr:hypothetical protein [Methylomirabilota bacterium]